MHHRYGYGKGSLSQRHPGAVEDYTKPFLYTFAFWIFCALTLIWAVWGFFLAILISLVANHILTVGAEKRAARISVKRPGPPMPPTSRSNTDL